MSEENKAQEEEKTAEAAMADEAREVKVNIQSGETAEAAAAASQAEAPADESKATDAQEANAEEKKDSAAKAPETVDYEKKAAELEDKLLRARAEFDNYRKRMAREFNEARDQARRTTVTDFLTVHDYFAMGMASIDTAPNLDILKQGMTMIWNEFQKVLDGLGVKAVDSIGKPFDAKIHEAISQEASDTVADGIVLREYKKAFMIGDKLLRPAVVVVSSGPAKPVDVTPEPAAETAAEQSPEEKREE